MTIFIYVVLAIIAIVIVLALVAPKAYIVSRSIEINKELPDVFQYLKFIKHQDEWSPWKQRDPFMTQEYFGTDGEVGFISKWEGNKEVGSGEQEIKGILENDTIKTELRFLKPWKSTSDAFIKVGKLDNGHTNVTWGFSGKNPMPFNIFMLFFNFEKAVGKDFEEGLATLKELLEK